MNGQIKSTLILLTTALIWGFAFVAQVNVDTNVLGNFTFNGLRYILGAAVLVPVILIFEKEKPCGEKFKKTVYAALLAGFAMFIGSALQQQGISMNHNAGKSSFITGLYTVLVPIFGWIFLRRKIAARTMLAALLSVAGLFLLSVGDGFDAVDAGDIVVLIGAFFWAVHILIIDKTVKNINPVTFSCLQFAVCGILHMLSAFFTETITFSGISATAAPILYSGLMSVGIGYTFQAIGQKDADPGLAAIVLSTECVFGAIGGALFLDESFTLKGYVGCVLIFAGIILSQLKKKGEA